MSDFLLGIEVCSSEGISDILLQLNFVFPEILSKNTDFTAFNMEHIKNRLKRRGLPCAVAADESHDVPLLQLERHIF